MGSKQSKCYQCSIIGSGMCNIHGLMGKEDLENDYSYETNNHSSRKEPLLIDSPSTSVDIYTEDSPEPFELLEEFTPEQREEMTKCMMRLWKYQTIATKFIVISSSQYELKEGEVVDWFVGRN